MPALLLLTAIALLTVTAVPAGAASSIEQIWAFGGGQIAIAPAANGTFAGTVVQATQFAECPHPVGQEIWKEMRAQTDGSFWGLHQWYFENSGCEENPQPGPTAWRVKEEPNGSKYLRVCFSKPGTTQPTIPSSGPETNVTYGCVSSTLTAPLPSASSVADFIQSQLPSTNRCASSRRFSIHLAEPRYDPFKTVRVTLKRRVIKTARRGNYVVASVSLKGLPAGSFTVKISATTVLGVHLQGSRTYHTCANKPKRRKPAKLKASTPRKSR